MRFFVQFHKSTRQEKEALSVILGKSSSSINNLIKYFSRGLPQEIKEDYLVVSILIKNKARHHLSQKFEWPL